MVEFQSTSTNSSLTLTTNGQGTNIFITISRIQLMHGKCHAPNTCILCICQIQNFSIQCAYFLVPFLFVRSNSKYIFVTQYPHFFFSFRKFAYFYYLIWLAPGKCAQIKITEKYFCGRVQFGGLCDCKSPVRFSRNLFNAYFNVSNESSRCGLN